MFSNCERDQRERNRKRAESEIRDWLAEVRGSGVAPAERRNSPKKEAE